MTGKKKKKKKKAKRAPPPRFAVGDKVRVKQGVRDYDNPDLPLAGWAGTISERSKGRISRVRWSEETLDAVHPVYRSRAERDGTALEEYRLGEDDLELDPGGPLASKTVRVKVTGFADADEELMMDDMYGLLCEARQERELLTLSLGVLELKKGDPNRQRVEDYSYWFWNWR